MVLIERSVYFRGTIDGARGALDSALATTRAGNPVFQETEFFIDNPLVRIHFIIEIIWWIGLAPWVFEFPF